MRFQFDAVGLAVLGDLADFVGVVHRVQSQPGLARAQDYGVFPLVHPQLGDGRKPRLLHRFDQQMIGFPASLFRNREVRAVIEKGIDLLKLDEFQDFHGLGRRRLDGGELLFFYQHILVFFVLVALHDLRPFDHPVAGRAEQRLAQARVAFLVQLVEVDALGAGCGEESQRNGNQPESQMPLPYTCRHSQFPRVKPAR